MSAAVARLFLDKFGKGPLHARTFINGDVMTTVLFDVSTTGERALIAHGHGERVLATRMLWQNATAQDFKDVIGRASGRRVLTVVSGFEFTADVATEVFVLAPAASHTER